jgi:hypothetical protein
MDERWRTILWRQFGAAIDMLDRALAACPDALWRNGPPTAPFWYVAYHAIFWLDYYLDEAPERFKPPEPFGLEELDPAGVMPPRPYTQAELRAYLAHGREKCRTLIAGLDEQGACAVRRHGWGTVDLTELMVYTMRHVQHHAAQLYLMLRQGADRAPGWVAQTKQALR